MMELLPTEGMPTRAASAMSFISSSIQCSSAGSPFSAKAGARRTEVTKWMLPRPPAPPGATMTRSPGCVRSAIWYMGVCVCGSSSRTTVPRGTLRTRSSPSLP